MKVYYNGNFWGHEKYERPMKRITVDRRLEWEELEVFWPAIYVSGKGIVADFCIRISVEKINAFLRRWNLPEAVEAYTQEEQRQIQRENPMEVHFNADVSIDGHRLKGRRACGASWIPISSMAGSDVKEVLEAYGYSLEDGWYVIRTAYQWIDWPILNPETLSVKLHADKISCEGEHFVTTERCGRRQMRLRHPLTGEDYELTIYDCRRKRLDNNSLLQQWEQVPRWYHVLTYEISPPPEDGEFIITDCAGSDEPKPKREGKKAAGAVSVIGGADGPTAIFFAGRERADKRSAYSALHYEPAVQVEWRTQFQVAVRPDREFEFDMRKEMKELI